MIGRERVSDDNLQARAEGGPSIVDQRIAIELLEARDRIARAAKVLRGNDPEERGGVGASPYDVLLGDVDRAIAILEQP